MKQNYDTLMPKIEETLIWKINECIKDFVINIGIFKSFGFVVPIILSLELINALSECKNLFKEQTITRGEFINGQILICLFLLIISYYEIYYIDNIIKRRYK